MESSRIPATSKWWREVLSFLTGLTVLSPRDSRQLGAPATGFLPQKYLSPQTSDSPPYCKTPGSQVVPEMTSSLNSAVQEGIAPSATDRYQVARRYWEWGSWRISGSVCEVLPTFRARASISLPRDKPSRFVKFPTHSPTTAGKSARNSVTT